MVKIIKKCDVCGKDIEEVNTIILYKNKIDFCESPKCIKKARKISQIIERELKYQNKMLDISMKNKEKEVLKTILKK